VDKTSTVLKQTKKQ
ncbi:23S rRNA methyltransferase attenuation leader peptide, partial [Enterococcus faecium]|nr:23S rRNA methyltransferase attenuation leader peptide [Enterococcus faecium]